MFDLMFRGMIKRTSKLLMIRTVKTVLYYFLLSLNLRISKQAEKDEEKSAQCLTKNKNSFMHGFIILILNVPPVL